MKHSGKSIQSRSLNRVLGNLDTLHVQPYEVFVEEERKKLHNHWLVCNWLNILIVIKKHGCVALSDQYLMLVFIGSNWQMMICLRFMPTGKKESCS